MQTTLGGALFLYVIMVGNIGGDMASIYEIKIKELI